MHRARVPRLVADAGRGAVLCAGVLAAETGPRHCPLPGGWIGGHALPHRRRNALGRLEPAGDRRQPRRRRRQCRGRDRLSRRARRLHAAVQPARPALDQPQPLQDPALRLGEVRAHRRAGGRAQRHHRPQGLGRQHGAGVDRLCQGQSRQGDLRLAGQRLDLAPLGADAGGDGGHRNGARALQGRGPGPDRHHRRPRRYLHRQHLGSTSVRAGQAGEIPGPCQQDSQPGCTRCARCRRDRPARPDRQRLVCPGRAARHARGHRAEDQRRYGGGPEAARSARKIPRTGR